MPPRRAGATARLLPLLAVLAIATPPGAARAEVAAPPGPARAEIAAPPGPARAEIATPPGPARTEIAAPPGPARAEIAAPPGPARAEIAAPPGPARAEIAAPPGPARAEIAAPPGPARAEIAAPPGPARAEIAAPPGPARAEIAAPPGPARAEIAAPPGPARAEIAAPPGPARAEIAAPPGPARAEIAPSACRRAIAVVEPGSGLPPGLLVAIALVESGRADPARGGRLEPWPWAYNVEGEGRFPATKAVAAAEVAALRAAGRQSIDVGCMQVNLLHHPAAFRDLDQAFEPEANVRYAARFLRELHARFGGNWSLAIAHYHSGEMERGLLYQRRVALARIGAAVAAGGPIPLPATAGKGLCAPGLSPVLTIRRPAARGAPAAATRIVCRGAKRAR